MGKIEKVRDRKINVEILPQTIFVISWAEKKYFKKIACIQKKKHVEGKNYVINFQQISSIETNNKVIINIKKCFEHKSLI